MRGGEPIGEMQAARRPAGFPTCVGVNRHLVFDRDHVERLPHVRGGEPQFARIILQQTPPESLPGCPPRNRANRNGRTDRHAQLASPDSQRSVQ